MILLLAEGGVDPNDVTPGVVGFLATFALVLVSILLFLNMNRRLRRMRHREQRAADERRAADEQRAAGEPDQREESPPEDRRTS